MSIIAPDQLARAQQLCDFINAAPTPYHAVAKMVEKLDSAGFKSLDIADRWQLAPRAGYYFTRNDSSLVAFTTGDGSLVDKGLRAVGAHTDSPCLKVKPHADVTRHGAQQLGVEVYGGVLLSPWFDRDLSLAGRVSYQGRDGVLASVLVDFQRPIVRIPSLAIHLDRDANDSRSVNAQNHLPLVLGGEGVDKRKFRELLAAELDRTHPELHPDRLYAYEIHAYDTQPAGVVGLSQEYISGARLDNLLSCFAGLDALLDAFQRDAANCQVLICADHEEIGSQSAVGSQGPIFNDLLDRLVADRQDRQRMVARSMLISADNAHALHPNYADRHEQNHGPRINAGPVIKINANQRYATNSENSAVFRQICDRVGEPWQEFVVRTDMGCGSTIGPVTAAKTGISTIDVGCPQWAMHSIRETAGVKDLSSMSRVMSEFFRRAEPFYG